MMNFAFNYANSDAMAERLIENSLEIKIPGAGEDRGAQTMPGRRISTSYEIILSDTDLIRRLRNLYGTTKAPRAAEL